MEKLRIKSAIIRGFSLVEVILATAVFSLLVTAFVGVYLYGQESSSMAGSRVRATFLAEEGIEALRNIKDFDFSSLTAGAHGISIVGNKWVLSGSSDTDGYFSRSVSITDVDSVQKDVSCTVSWQQNPQREGSVTVSTRFTNWQSTVLAPASCNDYSVGQGYTSGTCRQNAVQCNNKGEVYLSAGDVYCTGGASVDTCCALP